MELEELRSIWKSSKPGFQPKDESEIASMLTGRSLSIIDKLKRSVWFELIFTLVSSLGLLVYALTLPSGDLKWTSIAILAMCLAYIIYYIKKIILLNRFDPAKENIRANLVSLIEKLTGYLRFYRRSYTILYPVFFVVGLLFGGLARGADAFFENLLKPRTIIYLAIMAVVLYLLTSWLVNWYLKKLYGNHLEKLKSLLNDIQG
jgi:hypothetical protein